MYPPTHAFTLLPHYSLKNKEYQTIEGINKDCLINDISLNLLHFIIEGYYKKKNHCSLNNQ